MLLGVFRGVLTGAFAEDEQIGERVAAEAIGAVDARGAFAGGEQAGDPRHLRIAIHADTAHHVVCRRAHLHRLGGDVDVAQLFELVIHAGQFLLDVLRSVGQLLLDPGDVEVDAAVGAAASLFDFADDAAGDVVAREQFRRAVGGLVSLAVTPTFLFVLGGLRFVVVGDVLEHEAFALVVDEDAALAANAFGDQDAAHARRPDHAGRMELDKFHVDQLGPGEIGEGMTVAGVFPAIARDLVGLADAAGGEHDRLGAEDDEAAFLAIVSDGAGDAIAVLQEAQDRHLHVDIDALMDAVVLQGADHFEAGAVADVGQARIAMAAEVALKDAAILGAVEDGSPFLQFANTVGGLLGVQLGHAPVVYVLSAAHGISEVNLPVVAVIDVGERGGNAALRHDRVRFAEQRFADEPDRDAGRGRFDGRP